MDGQGTVKGFSAYQVNDGMLAKVVEAIKKGEADARRHAQIQSFEIYYEGFRERLVLGHIMIVPAKLADSPEDFPAALMYGAMMKEISPEQQADLYSYKLGESEFDEYDTKGLSEIKDRLFKDADGVYRSVILFVPTWANVRDYVIFKMTRDWELLTRMVRHQIFAAYYDPKFSVAFDHLAENSEKIDVSNITPKINYPGLAEGQLQSFPVLEPGDGGIKTAAAAKPRIFLAADTVNDITEEFLEPGEKAVIDTLSEDLKAKVNGEVEKPAEVAKVSQALNPTDSALKRLKDIHDDLTRLNTGLDVEGYRRLFIEARHLVGTYPNCKLYAQQYMTDLPKPGAVKAAAKQAAVEFDGEGLRARPDYGEEGSHTVDANEAAMKGAAANGKLAEEKAALTDESPIDARIPSKPIQFDELLYRYYEPLETAEEAEPEYYSIVLFQSGKGIWSGLVTPDRVEQVVGRDFAHKIRTSEGVPATGNQNGFTKLTKLPKKLNKRDHEMMREMGKTEQFDTPTFSDEDNEFLKGMGIRAKQAFVGARKALAGGDASAKTASAYRPLIEIEGGKLVPKGKHFIAMAKGGHRETLLINGNQVKWKNPLRFTAAFRSATETFIRNPKNHMTHKLADVPQTFDAIWDDIAEEMGPAPAIDIKEAPSKSTHSQAENTSGEPAAKKPESEADDTGDTKADAGFDAFIKKDDEGKTATKKTASGGIGNCVSCKTAVLATTGSEVAPGTFLHAACQEKAKKAAFDMFIPGQVISEFYPELQAETVDFPGGTQPGSTSDGFDPAIGLPGLSPTGVQQSADGIPGNGDAYISTDPTAAMGIGRDGKPQILEGAPLRQENDIRGYAFDQEYYAQQQSLDPKAFVAAYAVQNINKKASAEEFQAQLADFLKKAMGEIAATFIAAFKVTARPILNKVPGTGELQLDQVEQNNSPMPLGSTNVASRVRFLINKLTDSQITDSLNSAWSQAAVWNEDDNGGYTYEVFVRPESIDKTTMVLKYSFVVGTKGL